MTELELREENTHLRVALAGIAKECSEAEKAAYAQIDVERSAFHNQLMVLLGQGYARLAQIAFDALYGKETADPQC